jgi:hypothetical protein
MNASVSTKLMSGPPALLAGSPPLPYTNRRLAGRITPLRAIDRIKERVSDIWWLLWLALAGVPATPTARRLAEPGECNELPRQRDIAIGERNELLRQRDIAIGERNEFLRQRDIALGDRNECLRQRAIVLGERNELLRQRNSGA